MFDDLQDFYEWFAQRNMENSYEIKKVSLDEMPGWGSDPRTGDISHESGKFFSIRGLRVSTDHRETARWEQPIIVQPEIGILGMIVKVVNGRTYCLMQAKMEPGNVNLLQLSPTVQATRSNYTGVHQGNKVPYLEYFVAPRSGRVVVDALQSEQGSWFLNKRNRNIIVEVHDDVPVGDDFCWLSLDQIAELMRVPNLINMDSRTVLSGISFVAPEWGEWAETGLDHGCGLGEPLHSKEQLLSWFTEVKSQYSLERELVPLSEITPWRNSPGRIEHVESRHFSVVGVHVTATNREVSEWSQPMLEPVERGVVGFLGRNINGLFHILVHARTEAGTYDIVEMAPTVSCIPGSYTRSSRERWPRYFDELLRAGENGTLVDVVHSEEGGRFYHAENRYLVVDAGEGFGLDVPEDYCWMTVEQLMEFVRYGNHVNVAARCLLSCLVDRTTRKQLVEI
ncbi:NDP-hexose 2,3-dehydratase family protein [Actinopolyspora mortivallis]|uniref:NDP-hexose 2,3-dehydratase n=1 Tax=Actinopolyspora mortivallis TaxID=33906 RepID=A0A2T0GS93_ACTMO|nr:NDP-hexose 2,3-dehydratase family protein [Actinopolyspora mortivallis]PRW61986.1 NDP-hexose 2,3-dehydratase [Actinopolyspora mortivallis]